MGVLSFFNSRKPRQFYHQPIYFDPRKEALEKRIHKVKVDLGIEEANDELRKDAIRGSFIEGTTHLRKSKNKGVEMSDRTSRNMRLLLILALLAFAFWFFFLK